LSLAFSYSVGEEEEERAGFAAAIGADGRIALFRACRYPSARHMLARTQQDHPC
jgi:hypothetical protein